IELGEIEAALCGHPDLSACAVVTQNEGGGDKTLAAFVVGREQAEMSIGTLRQWLGEKLPEYMIPSRFFVLPVLPLTPNGKVDRQTLQKLDGMELAAGTDYVAPRNELEFKLAEMWQLQQTLADTATYNAPVAFRLSGRVDRERVRRALQAIVERHEVLRIALVQNGEILVQQIAAAKDVPLPWLEVDLLAVPPSQKQSALEERLLEEARRPFDLAQAPLWRVVWIKLAEDEHVLGITLHHSIVDEWTLRLFFQEWERLYAADGRLEVAGLPELPVQYADYAAWQRQRLTGELLEQQRSYWREQLQELPPPLELPTDMAR